MHSLAARLRLVAPAIVLASLVALTQPITSFARDLLLEASIIKRDGNSLVVKTSGNETLTLDLGWFKNQDGYALKPDEFFCIEAQQLPDGKIMVVSIQTCEELRQREEKEKDDREHEQQEDPR